MPDVTRILSQIEQGDPQAAEKLLPLVYDELRKLAASKLAAENPGLTLSATGLVHEAYLRLIGPREKAITDSSAAAGPKFDSCGHFFAAAAEAMRRILVEAARRRSQMKRGAGRKRIELDEAEIASSIPVDHLLLIDEALDDLEKSDAQMAQLVKLHCFGGLSIEEAANVLGLAVRSAYRDWAFVRAWLFRRLANSKSGDTR